MASINYFLSPICNITECWNFMVLLVWRQNEYKPNLS